MRGIGYFPSHSHLGKNACKDFSHSMRGVWFSPVRIFRRRTNHEVRGVNSAYRRTTKELAVSDILGKSMTSFRPGPRIAECLLLCGLLMGLVPAQNTLSANVRDYGAKGDGVSDDSDAIQAAIDHTLPGGVVFIPAGIYIVATTHHTYATLGPNFRD